MKKILYLCAVLATGAASAAVLRVGPGEEYKTVSHGRFRVFSAEEMLRFRPTDARYLKLEILTTVGKECQRPKFVDAPIVIGELSPFYLRPLIK